MKRIIPVILIIVLFSCIVLPFAVSAWDNLDFPPNYSLVYFNLDIYDFTQWYDDYQNYTTITFANSYYNAYSYNNSAGVSGLIDGLSFYKSGSVRYFVFMQGINYRYGFSYNINTEKLFFFVSSAGSIEISFDLHVSYVYTDLQHPYVGFKFADNTYSNQISELNNLLSNSGFRSRFYSTPPSSTYTLTFDSQGGSSISPITNIESGGTVNLMDPMGIGYNPTFIPTRYGYDFQGWASTPNGVPNITSVTVTENTTIYAIWEQNSNYFIITFPTGFYSDSNLTHSISGNLLLEGGTSYTFYCKPSELSLANNSFYGQIELRFNGNNQIYNGIEQGNDKYKFTINVPYSSGSIYLVTYVTYGCTVYCYNNLWSQYFNNIYLNGVPVLNNSQVFHFDSYNGIRLEFDMYPPYVVTDVTFTDVLYGPFLYEIPFSVYSEIIETDNDYGFYCHVTCIAYPTQGGVVSVFNRSISDYDITSRAPIIVYDESGNASWAFSEVEVMDTDWSQVQENIPRKLFGIFDGLFTLEGLAVLIPVIMMVSFTVWFLRRS